MPPVLGAGGLLTVLVALLILGTDLASRNGLGILMYFGC